MPHVTKMKRKPKGVGGEFENSAGVVAGMCMRLEVAEGKVDVGPALLQASVLCGTQNDTMACLSYMPAVYCKGGPTVRLGRTSGHLRGSLRSGFVVWYNSICYMRPVFLLSARTTHKLAQKTHAIPHHSPYAPDIPTGHLDGSIVTAGEPYEGWWRWGEFGLSLIREVPNFPQFHQLSFLSWGIKKMN